MCELTLVEEMAKETSGLFQGRRKRHLCRVCYVESEKRHKTAYYCSVCRIPPRPNGETRVFLCSPTTGRHCWKKYHNDKAKYS